LIENGADLNAVTSDGWTALHFAAFKGYDKITKLLLDAGIDPNLQGYRYGRTALHYAAEQGRLNSAVQILQKNVDINIKDKSGITALDLAIKSDHKDIIAAIKSQKNVKTSS
jgi:ankyrin repeat protein